MAKRTASSEPDYSQDPRFKLMRRLPFVTYDPEIGVKSWWSLPATGSYTGGCRAGSAAATVFMKYLRDSQHDAAYSLSCVLRDMVYGKPESLALHGQLVGFLGVLANAATQVAKLDSGLDSWSYDCLRDMIDHGLRLHEEPPIEQVPGTATKRRAKKIRRSKRARQ